ncbi:head decoration protein (plasmid) [Nissabacter sp. SGAir0207]|nr:head decoration protein [Nissabacter sp. SGAir0207]QCR38977.1 head decoration protein [Nissabacter sp. SGAir0207]
MNSFGQNPWQPAVYQDTFIPDQLIGGNTPPLVTDTVTLASGHSYKRGTILGRVTADNTYVLCVSTATDGSQIPSGVLVNDVDTTGGVAQAGVYQMGTFNVNRIIYDDSWTVANLKEGLRPLGIFLRDSVVGPGV